MKNNAKNKSEKIIVTGCAGFIGSHICEELLSLGHSVVGVDNFSTGKRENIESFSKNKAFRLVQKNVEDSKLMDELFKEVKPAIVFHLAALPRIQPSIKDPIKSNETNVAGTLSVLHAAYLAGVRRVVYSASSSVYGDQGLPLKEKMKTGPKTPYSLQKLIGEQYCALYSSPLYNLDTVCLRYFNVYGERQSCEGAYATVIGIFLEQKKKGEPLTIVGDGHRSRDFTYVKDVVRANILAMNHEGTLEGRIINIGTGISYSIKRVAGMISENQMYIEDRKGEIEHTRAAIDTARAVLGWEPKTNLEKWIQSLSV